MMGKRILMERIDNLDERLCELRYDFNLALKKSTLWSESFARVRKRK